MGTKSTTGSGMDFHETGTESRLTPDQLETCHEPHDSRRSKGDIVCYAVARINGAVQYRFEGDLMTRDGCTVLYVHPEGLAAIERNFAVGPKEYSSIDAYSFVDPDSPQAVVCDPDTFRYVKPVLDAHPHID